MKIETKTSAMKLGLILAVLFVGASFRFMDLPPNFSPIGAIALFAGAFLPRRLFALGLPLAVLFLSDLFLGFYPDAIFVYASFALCAFIGFQSLKKFSWIKFGISNLSCALSFFFITNLGVWLMTPLYSKNLSGLFTCFEMAIPFFRNTMASQFIFAAIFFGVYEFATKLSGLKTKPAL